MFDGLNDAVMATFAEPFVYKHPDGDIVLSGVLDERIDEQGVAAAGFADRIYTLFIGQSVVVNNGIVLHGSLVVRDVDYQIVDMQADIGGMVTMSIRAY